jgi:hypothetical protein
MAGEPCVPQVAYPCTASWNTEQEWNPTGSLATRQEHKHLKKHVATAQSLILGMEYWEKVMSWKEARKCDEGCAR